MATGEAPNRISGDALARLLEDRQQFLGFLTKRISSRELAEDILQAAFVRALERGGEIRDEESAVAWFYRMLRNAVIDQYRRGAVADTGLAALAREMEDSHVPPPDVRNEVCQCVSAILKDLKPEYREALEQVDIEEGSLAELAEKIGISANNAAVRVHRAREALRKQVKLTCGVCATHGCVDCRCKACP